MQNTPQPSVVGQSLGIPGLHYFPSVITPAEQRDLLAMIDRQPWRGHAGHGDRRIQRYGYDTAVGKGRLDKTMYLGPFPDWLKAVVTKLLTNNIVAQEPDQCSVNEYVPGQGIAYHTDYKECFGDTILTLSLGDVYCVDFQHPKTKEVRSFPLGLGSILRSAGESRYDWKHSIAKRKTENGIPRKRRVSLTFRTAILG